MPSEAGKYEIGEMVEVHVSGYGFGFKPHWISAEISRPQTAKRVWVKFRIKNLKEIERALAYDNVRKLGDRNLE